MSDIWNAVPLDESHFAAPPDGHGATLFKTGARFGPAADAQAALYGVSLVSNEIGEDD